MGMEMLARQRRKGADGDCGFGVWEASSYCQLASRCSFTNPCKPWTVSFKSARELDGGCYIVTVFIVHIHVDQQQLQSFMESY